MTRVEQLAAEKEAKSLAVYEELTKHETNHRTMLREFETADKKCVDTARQLAPLDLADSPTAEPLRMQIRTLRAERDGIRWDWNRRRDLLQAKLESINLPEILMFHRWVTATAQRLQGQISTEYRSYVPTNDGRRRIQCSSNVSHVAQVKAALFLGLKMVQALRLRPLLEIHTKINSIVSEYEDAIQDLRMVEINVSESEHTRLQSVSHGLEREESTLVAYRGGLRITT